jgi:polyhydroxyalkanoate synthase
MDEPPFGEDLLSDPAALVEFGANLTKASLIGQQAILQSVGGIDPTTLMSFDPLAQSNPLLDAVMTGIASPESLAQTQAKLAQRTFDVWQDACSAFFEGLFDVPSADRRFAGEAWRQPYFDAIRRAYDVNAKLLSALSSRTDLGDAKANRRLQFLTKLLTDLFSPSNFLASNPDALAEALRTRGESLVRGMENFAADLKRGGGELAISQTDMSKFAIGENLATTPGKVVFQNELLQLIQYAPATDQVREIPLLIVTALINKYYILDLQPGNSLVRWLTEQGFTVFITSWANPDVQHASKTFEDYMAAGLLTAMDKVIDQCGVEHINVLGYCISGTLLGCTLAYLAAKKIESPVSSATFLAAQHDFSDAGDLGLFIDDGILHEAERRMDKAGGVLPGQSMSEAFNLLRANDLIFSFLVNNYLLGKTPKAFDLLYWNADQTRIPKALGLWYLRAFYQENRLANGSLELAGARLDLSAVTTPVFVQSAVDDHIAPPESVYRGARLFGGPVTFVLAGSGHIAGVVNPPSAQKYQHWTNRQFPETLRDWKAGAQEAKGSWWPAWAEWLHERSGRTIAARDPSAGPLPPIEDAPGAYVKVRSSS